MTEKYLLVSQALRLALLLPMQNSTSGGSSDSEANALMVTPAGRPSSPTVVTTQTPEAKRPSASRKVRGSTVTAVRPNGETADLAAAN